MKYLCFLKLYAKEMVKATKQQYIYIYKIKLTPIIKLHICGADWQALFRMMGHSETNPHAWLH